MFHSPNSDLFEPHRESMTLIKESSKTDKTAGKGVNNLVKNLPTVNKEKHEAVVCGGVNTNCQIGISQIKTYMQQ